MPLPRKKCNILGQALLWQQGRWVPKSALRDLLYDTDPSGGPVFIDKCLDIFILELRQRGWDIECKAGFGVKLLEGGKDNVRRLHSVHSASDLRLNIHG